MATPTSSQGQRRCGNERFAVCAGKRHGLVETGGENLVGIIAMNGDANVFTWPTAEHFAQSFERLQAAIQKFLQQMALHFRIMDRGAVGKAWIAFDFIGRAR